MAGLAPEPGVMHDALARQLAAIASRSALPTDALLALRRLFPEARLIRLSFGLQNKVMVSVTLDLQASREGCTHASFVPIHPTAAAAAVLQNNPVVVVRAPDKRSPLWDQEDLYLREACKTLNVVSMPFVWEPPPNALGDGRLLPMPQTRSLHPTFGALTAGSDELLSQSEVQRLQQLAQQTGRHVGPHIAMLLASLEGAALVPSETEAQEEMRGVMEPSEDEGEDSDGGDMGDTFGFNQAAARAADEHATILGLVEAEEAMAAEQAAAVEREAGAAAPAAQQAALEPDLAQIVAALAADDPVAAIQAAMAEVLRLQGQQQQAGGEPPQGAPPGAGAQDAFNAAAFSRALAEAALAPEIGSASAGRDGPSGAWHPHAAPAPASAAVTSHGSVAAAALSQPPSQESTPGVAVALAALPQAGALHPLSSLAFEAPGLERAFALHYGRAHQKSDVAAVALLLVALLAATGLHMSGQWTAGVASLLLFAPYFLDTRLYHGLRDVLLSAALLLAAAFLGSLTSTDLASGSGTPLGSCPWPEGGGAGAGAGGSGTAQLEGFGICWFVLHTCGLAYVLAAPLLLRLRVSRALPVQGANLALALHRLPHAYATALGRLDAAHVLLLGLLLIAGAGGALLLSRQQERRMRESWLRRRVLRAASAVEAAQGGTGSTSASGSSLGRRPS